MNDRSSVREKIGIDILNNNSGAINEEVMRNVLFFMVDRGYAFEEIEGEVSGVTGSDLQTILGNIAGASGIMSAVDIRNALETLELPSCFSSEKVQYTDDTTVNTIITALIGRLDVDYKTTVLYDAGEIVVSGGLIYRCKAITTGNTPPNTTYWECLSLQMDAEQIRAALESLTFLDRLNKSAIVGADFSLNLRDKGNLNDTGYLQSSSMFNIKKGDFWIHNSETDEGPGFNDNDWFIAMDEGMEFPFNFEDDSFWMVIPLNKLDDTGKAAVDNVLTLDNEVEFIPDNDYEPATKKYTDDNDHLSLIYKDTCAIDDKTYMAANFPTGDIKAGWFWIADLVSELTEGVSSGDIVIALNDNEDFNTGEFDDEAAWKVIRTGLFKKMDIRVLLADSFISKTTDGATGSVYETNNGLNFNVFAFPHNLSKGVQFFIKNKGDISTNKFKFKAAVFQDALSGTNSDVIFSIKATIINAGADIDQVMGSSVNLLLLDLDVEDYYYESNWSSEVIMGGGALSLDSLICFEVFRNFSHANDTLDETCYLTGITIKLNE